MLCRCLRNSGGTFNELLKKSLKTLWFSIQPVLLKLDFQAWSSRWWWTRNSLVFYSMFINGLKLLCTHRIHQHHPESGVVVPVLFREILRPREVLQPAQNHIAQMSYGNVFFQAVLVSTCAQSTFHNNPQRGLCWGDVLNSVWDLVLHSACLCKGQGSRLLPRCEPLWGDFNAWQCVPVSRVCSGKLTLYDFSKHWQIHMCLPLEQLFQRCL